MKSSYIKIGSCVFQNLKGITPKYVENSNTIVINQKCIRNNFIDFSLAQFVSIQQNISEDKFLRVGDLLVNSTGQGTAGRCAYVDQLPEDKKVVTDSHILILRCNNNIIAKCISEVLYSNESLIQSFLEGSSGQSELDRVRLFNLRFKLPEDENSKQFIAKFSQEIINKLALNTRINAELEAMAKSLYDYWFVQYDFPDGKGKPYKASGGKMVWNVQLKREIPEAWEVDKIGDRLYTTLGGTPSTTIKEYWEGGTISWLNSGEIASFPIIESELKITEAAVKNSATDILPKGSIMLSITRHLRPSVLAIDACANQSVVGIKEKGDIRYFYLYPYLKNEVPRLNAMRSGAQQPHINKEIVDESLIVIPNESSSVLKEYNYKVGPLYERIINNALQNQQLTELRDWLLPLLMNGQVTVWDSAENKASYKIEDEMRMVAEPD